MLMNATVAYKIGIVMAALGVALGAFGAHGLRPILEGNARTETFELAVRYQFYHSFAIIFCGLLMQRLSSSHLKRAVFCFATGIVIFSGSLYTLSLSGMRGLGAITPVGGILFITGWVFLFLSINKKSLT